MADDKIQGVPEGLTEEPMANTTGIQGVPEGLTETPLHMAGAGGSWEPQGTASKIWEGANKPLIPEGRAEKEGKEYATSAPTLSETEHPYLTGAKKGVAGAYADTLDTVRGLSSPLGVATMGLGKLAEGAGGAVGKIAKIGSRAAGIGFGTQGIKQAVEGGEDIAAHGANPENIKSTLQGAGFGVLGGTGALHGTEVGEAPAQKTLAAPIRAASDLAEKVRPHVPHIVGAAVGGAVGGALGHPLIGTLAGGALGTKLVPKEFGAKTLAKGSALGLTDAEANLKGITKDHAVAQSEQQAAQREYDKHSAGTEQGIPAPKSVLDAKTKADEHLQLMEDHLKAAQDKVAEEAKNGSAAPDQAITPEGVEAARPESPQEPTPTKEENDAKLSGLMDQIAPAEKPAENVKVPGQVQPETFPQEPTAVPAQATGLRQLGPEGKGGVMGRQLALPEPREAEGVPEAAPEAPVEPATRPLAPPAPATAAEMAGLKAVGGKVEEAPEKAVAPLVKQGLSEGSRTARPVAVGPVAPAEKALGRIPDPDHDWRAGHEPEAAPVAEAPKELGASESDKRRKALVEGVAKKEGVKQEYDAKTGMPLPLETSGRLTIGKEAPKEVPERSPEDMSKVEGVVKDHSDQELARLGKRYGVDESKYDFSKRDEKRHRVERDDFVNDLLSKMPEKDIDNIARLAGEFDNKDATTWTSAERSNLSRAQRARAIMQEHTGGPKTVGGGTSEKAAKKLPTGDELVKKYGESSGDPLDVTFILEDGRAVANTGVDHDTMLGGKATDKNPPRDTFVQNGNIRVRPRQGTIGGREVSISIPPKGVNEAQLAYINKMQPQLRSGAVLIENGERGGDYRVIEHGKATKETLENAINELAPKKVGAPRAEELSKVAPGRGLRTKEGDLSPEEVAAKVGTEAGSKEAWETLRKTGRNTADNSPAKGGTEEGAKQDTDHFAQAKKELPNGTLSEQLGRAQELKQQPVDQAEAHNTNGGSTFHPVHGNLDGKPFFAVGGEPEFKNPDLKMTVDGNKLTAEQIAEFRNRPVVKEAIKNNPDASYGTWHDQATNKTTMELSKTPGDRTESITMGVRNGEKAIWDSENHTEINTGGDGNGGVGKGDQKALTPEVRAIVQAELAKQGQSGGAPSAAPKMAKEPSALPELAEKHLTPEEKAGVLKSPAQTEKFVQRMSEIPDVQEYTDIALAGEGAHKWYQRSSKAFDAMTEESPEYFKEDGDKDKFINLLAASSPRQSVAMNLRETLSTWKAYVDAGRPTGDALKDLLNDNLTPAISKTPNAMKALNGEEMWPDLSKNKNFKVPSFALNLRGWLNAVTSDGWMSLFAGLDPREIASAHSYHPLAIATRAAAEALGWEPAEAQAAIWSFTQALQERGEELPEEIRKHSEDFVDLMAHDPQTRQLLADLGVTHANLDAKLAAIGEKPEVTGRTTATTSRSIGKLKERIEAARGQGSIPPSKSAQGALDFREAPARESRVRDADTEFNPEQFRTQAGEDTKLKPLGKKKSPLGNAKR